MIIVSIALVFDYCRKPNLIDHPSNVYGEGEIFEFPNAQRKGRA